MIPPPTTSRSNRSVRSRSSASSREVHVADPNHQAGVDNRSRAGLVSPLTSGGLKAILRGGRAVEVHRWWLGALASASFDAHRCGADRARRPDGRFCPRRRQHSPARRRVRGRRDNRCGRADGVRSRSSRAEQRQRARRGPVARPGVERPADRRARPGGGRVGRRLDRQRRDRGTGFRPGAGRRYGREPSACLGRPRESGGATRPGGAHEPAGGRGGRRVGAEPEERLEGGAKRPRGRRRRRAGGPVERKQRRSRGGYIPGHVAASGAGLGERGGDRRTGRSGRCGREGRHGEELDRERPGGGARERRRLRAVQPRRCPGGGGDQARREGSREG